jgi:outer membrane immunogenic protein
MRKTTFAAVAGGVLALVAVNTASAADLPVKAAPVAVAAFDWTGWYLGGSVGYARGGSTLTDVNGYNDFPPSFSYNPSGIQAGGHVGFNKQFSRLVVGIEAELGYLGVRKSSQFPPFIGVRTANDSLASTSNGWFGVIAGRLGLALNNWLIYGKGGAIFTGIKNSFIDTDPTGIVLTSGTQTGSRNGWTLGAGVEHAFTRNWIARVEYAHYAFGTKSHTATSSAFPATPTFRHSLNLNSVRLGVSYLFH